jgi:hypothetical protein
MCGKEKTQRESEEAMRGRAVEGADAKNAVEKNIKIP